MLPFLKNKERQVAGVIMKTRSSDESEEQDDSSAAIDACSRDLIDAIAANNVKLVSEAIKSAFDILQSMPEDSVEPHSYDAQNIKAAKGNE